MQVFSEDWGATCCARLNDNARFRSAAAGWDGPIVLEMTAEPAHGVPEDRSLWIDLVDGECRGARAADPDDRASAAYVLVGSPPDWVEVLRGGVDPISSLMRGKLRLEKGSYFSLAKYVPAARELVATVVEVGGELPGPSEDGRS
jgi:putative sterol carrier protein